MFLDRLVGMAFTAALLAAGVLAFLTAQENPSVQELSRQTACGPGSSCVVEGPVPHHVDRNPFRHRYEWASSTGPVVVDCRRALLWLGDWECGVDRRVVGSAGGEVGNYPDAVKRRAGAK